MTMPRAFEYGGKWIGLSSVRWLGGHAVAEDDALHSRLDLADVLDWNEHRPGPEKTSANEKRSRISAVAVENVLDDPEAPSGSLHPKAVAGREPIRASGVLQPFPSHRYLILGVM
jgi:hypothetical protein